MKQKFFKFCNQGSRRWVFLIGKYAVKIPKFSSWLSMLLGFMENLEERYWWCADGIVRKTWSDGPNEISHHMCEIFWADRFGFMVIMERVAPCTEEQYKQYEEFLKNKFKGLSFVQDLKPDNVGICADGRVVITDFGFFGGISQLYLGRKVNEYR